MTLRLGQMSARTKKTSKREKYKKRSDSHSKFVGIENKTQCKELKTFKWRGLTRRTGALSEKKLKFFKSPSGVLLHVDQCLRDR